MLIRSPIEEIGAKEIGVRSPIAPSDELAYPCASFRRGLNAERRNVPPTSSSLHGVHRGLAFLSALLNLWDTYSPVIHYLNYPIA